MISIIMLSVIIIILLRSTETRTRTPHIWVPSAEYWAAKLNSDLENLRSFSVIYRFIGL